MTQFCTFVGFVAGVAVGALACAIAIRYLVRALIGNDADDSQAD